MKAMGFKGLLVLTSLLPLLAMTSGCVVAEDHPHYYHRDHWDHRGVIYGPPAVEVRPPEVIVR